MSSLKARRQSDAKAFDKAFGDANKAFVNELEALQYSASALTATMPPGKNTVNSNSYENLKKVGVLGLMQGRGQEEMKQVQLQTLRRLQKQFPQKWTTTARPLALPQKKVQEIEGSFEEEGLVPRLVQLPEDPKPEMSKGIDYTYTKNTVPKTWQDWKDSANATETGQKTWQSLKPFQSSMNMSERIAETGTVFGPAYPSEVQSGNILGYPASNWAVKQANEQQQLVEEADRKQQAARSGRTIGGASSASMSMSRTTDSLQAKMDKTLQYDNVGQPILPPKDTFGSTVLNYDGDWSDPYTIGKGVPGAWSRKRRKGSPFSDPKLTPYERIFGDPDSHTAHEQWHFVKKFTNQMTWGYEGLHGYDHGDPNETSRDIYYIHFIAKPENVIPTVFALTCLLAVLGIKRSREFRKPVQGLMHT